MMDPANARREDLEKAAYTLSAHSSEPPKPKPSKMSRFRHITCALLVVAVLAFTLTSAAGNGGNGIARMSISAADRQRFQELLNSVDPKALHNVLHAAEDKYQHGIFKEDKTAMEVVHEENAEVATSLVELAKRQAGNNTTTTTTTPGTTSQTSTVDPTTSETSQAPPTTAPTTSPTVAPTPTTSENPTTPTTQPSVGPTTQPTTAQTTTPTTTRAPTTAAPTPPTSAGQSSNGASPTPSSTTGSPTPSSNVPSPSSSSTRGGATSSSIAQSVSTRRQTSNVPTVRSSSTLATETSADDNPTTTSARSVTQQTIYTTTLANGAVATVTQVTVVAGQADQTGGSSARTSSAKGSLQTNAASLKNAGMNGLLGALGMVVVGAL